jgi:hypothetical protein
MLRDRVDVAADPVASAWVASGSLVSASLRFASATSTQRSRGSSLFPVSAPLDEIIGVTFGVVLDVAFRGGSSSSSALFMSRRGAPYFLFSSCATRHCMARRCSSSSEVPPVCDSSALARSTKSAYSCDAVNCTEWRWGPDTATVDAQARRRRRSLAPERWQWSTHLPNLAGAPPASSAAPAPSRRHTRPRLDFAGGCAAPRRGRAVRCARARLVAGRARAPA